MDESGYHYDADALRALDDPRSTVFLTGKAGAGKSTLLTLTWLKPRDSCELGLLGFR